MLNSPRGASPRLPLVQRSARAAKRRPTLSRADSVRATVFIISCALLLGALVRISFVTAFDFPLNDGGLFYTMSSDLQSNSYRIPEFTTYNFDRIPFAYPPLSLYAASLVDDATPLSMFGVFRLLPLCASIATMFAFLALARRILPDRVSLVAAVTAFALIPRSFEWMIMGGGLTRSLGLFFAVLALHEAHRLYVGRRRSAAVTLGVLAGLTLLSHLEIAWFLAFSTVILLAAHGRHRTGALGTLAAVAIAVAVAAPWWITVLTQHGASPFVAAATTSSPSAGESDRHVPRVSSHRRTDVRAHRCAGTPRRRLVPRRPPLAVAGLAPRLRAARSSWLRQRRGDSRRDASWHRDGSCAAPAAAASQR